MYDILLLDDARATRCLLSLLLTKAGWSVGQAEDTTKALTVLNGAGARVLVADAWLSPTENGHSFARAVTRLWPELSVIFTSTDPAVLAGVVPRHGDRCIPKELLPTMIVDQVAAILGPGPLSPPRMRDIPVDQRAAQDHAACCPG